MVPVAHSLFRRWAAWVTAPVGGVFLGIGDSIFANLAMPRSGGRSPVPYDPIASKVDKFVSKLPKHEKMVIKTFYLDLHLTVDEKAKKLHLSKRALYDTLHSVQRVMLVVLDDAINNMDARA